VFRSPKVLCEMLPTANKGSALRESACFQAQGSRPGFFGENLRPCNPSCSVGLKASLACPGSCRWNRCFLSSPCSRTKFIGGEWSTRPRRCCCNRVSQVTHQRGLALGPAGIFLQGGVSYFLCILDTGLPVHFQHFLVSQSPRRARFHTGS
jgi:hypothetical protein